MHCRVYAAAMVSLWLACAAMAQSNVIINGDFESNPPQGFGNNIPYPIPPWTLIGTAEPNVVTVDGPGGLDYGSNGPESDASAPGAGIAQHYLDIVNDENAFYQSFTPRCSGQVQFGGSFSTRANAAGTAFVEIRQGVGPNGPLVGTTNHVNLAGGNSKLDPWTNVSFSVPITAFQTYSFVVYMDNQLNFDNAFVRYDTDCPAPDPCCPPWNASALEEMMIYQGTGGISAPYTLRFQPAPAFNSQMQAYIDYVHLLNPAATQITMEFRLHDGGNGTAPFMGTLLGVPHYITWQAGLSSGPFPAPSFFSGPPETMVVNHWYYVHTGIYLENGQQFFPASCANNDIGVRIQVQPQATTRGAPAVLMIRHASGRIVTKPLRTH
jgi:hypothetical protein